MGPPGATNLVSHLDLENLVNLLVSLLPVEAMEHHQATKLGAPTLPMGRPNLDQHRDAVQGAWVMLEVPASMVPTCHDLDLDFCMPEDRI